MKNKLISLLVLLTLLPQFEHPAFPALTPSDKSVNPATAGQLLSNPGFEFGKASWTASGGTFTTTTTAANVGFGNASGSWDSNASSQTLISSTSFTNGNGATARNMVASCDFKCDSGTCSHTITADDGTNNLATPQTITSSTTNFVRTSVNFVSGTGGTTRLKITSVASDEPKLYIDQCYVGPAEAFNLANVSQAQFMGAVVVTGCAAAWTTTSTSFADPSTQSGCSYVASGQASAPSTNLPALKFANGLPPGEYVLQYEGILLQSTNPKGAYYQFSDGTNQARETSQIVTVANGGSPGLFQSITYNTAQSGPVTLKVQMKTDSGGLAEIWGTNANPGVFKVYRFPTTTQTLLSPNQPLLPTISTVGASSHSGGFSANSSGTYTTPTGVSWIHIQMVGGGGGGGGSGTSTTGGNGSDGGDTTFGSSLLTAGKGHGGGKSNSDGGTGGTATINSPAFGSGWSGGSGGGFLGAPSSGLTVGVMGASSPWSGGGSYSSVNGTANAAVANSGAGGASGLANVVSTFTGGGGGAGAYVDAVIVNPAATYSFAVGALGGHGTSGTNGFAGGDGSAGWIQVTEYYGAFNSPVLVGGVISPQNTAGATTINNLVTKSASYGLTANDETVTFSGLGGGVTATLPDATLMVAKKFIVKNEDASNDVTINTTSSQTYDGRASGTIVLSHAFHDFAQFQSDGSNWKILAKKETQTLTNVATVGGVGATGAGVQKYIGNGCTLALTIGVWHIKGWVGLTMGTASASDFFTFGSGGGFYSADASSGAQGSPPTAFSPAASQGYITGLNGSIGTQFGGASGYGSGAYLQVADATVTVTSNITIYLVEEFATAGTTGNGVAMQAIAERVW